MSEDQSMKMQGIEYGVKFYAEDGTAPIYVEVLTHDNKFGTVLLVATKHGAVEVRVTPEGTRVKAHPSDLLPRELAGWDEEEPYYPGRAGRVLPVQARRLRGHV